jgi:hypothetical protein
MKVDYIFFVKKNNVKKHFQKKIAIFEIWLWKTGQENWLFSNCRELPNVRTIFFSLRIFLISAMVLVSPLF